MLDAEDVIGKRIVTTRLRGNVTIREENATAALEVMSRFAADPKWLIYLPPTMSPCETSQEDGHLEHPAEAFSYYRAQRISKVICEEKHMGSRAVVVVCRDVQTARDRFGVTSDESGIVSTRTGRRFFNDNALEKQFLDRLRGAMDGCDFWNKFSTDWACLDCELMPWSAKAQTLLQSQYAAVGAAGRASLPKVVGTLNMAARRMDSEITTNLARRYEASPVCGSVRRRLPALLLDGRIARRSQAGPVPPTGHREQSPRRSGPHLASGDHTRSAHEQAVAGKQDLPLFLRGIAIDRVNQVWSTDITYVPMRSGFMYLTAGARLA